MDDDRTPLEDIPPLTKSVEELEEENGQPSATPMGQPGSDVRLDQGVLVPPVYGAMGGGGVGVPAPGAPVIPVVPIDGHDDADDEQNR